MPHAVYLSQLLDIKMDHLAWGLMFVADHSRPGLQAGQPVQAQAPKLTSHRGDGHGKKKGCLQRAHAPAPQGRDGGHPLHRQAPGTTVGPGAAVMQSGFAALPVAGQPLVDRAPADTQPPGYFPGAKEKTVTVLITSLYLPVPCEQPV